MSGRRYSQISQQEGSSSSDDSDSQQKKTKRTVAHRSPNTTLNGMPRVDSRARPNENSGQSKSSNGRVDTDRKMDLLRKRSNLVHQTLLLEKEVRVRRNAINQRDDSFLSGFIKSLLEIDSSVVIYNTENPDNPKTKQVMPSAEPKKHVKLNSSISSIRFTQHEFEAESEKIIHHSLKGDIEYLPSFKFLLEIKVRTIDYALLFITYKIPHFARKELSSFSDSAIQCLDIVALLRAFSLFAHHYSYRCNTWFYLSKHMKKVASANMDAQCFYVQNSFYKITILYEIKFDDLGFVQPNYCISYILKNQNEKIVSITSKLLNQLDKRFSEFVSLFGFREGSLLLLQALFKPHLG
ncbi:CENP-P ortholog Fta2 [Schizosaccharomyces pombe]|uniref:Inner kinetochore subunit fta2 n=1 Tax=Schizosaccharomyces pombe (strain 972 / ATCC 24843) TaxID=284812 RepID=CENPP_SCHPO|nr:Sim4 and Mal2-associated protein 2 [Schizosaccharomyces pombe]Q9US26.1 RecName: Full=Inner kinetochore subunit fta2; AltName: Full=CENP-P homolog; AltName: Full=Constitutive centromere-associated network protein fta2; AltName: Full=Sim4 complex subunit fta2; AltName: Full=Sim4-mal2-associated protein 2 [Schizosaccharomyces pombe 972h-]CAB66166.1 Sim4 and Mal2 associated (4 and 2 associated) protein 2 [Schizosaccharomyces pombe]|eukprot:NP_593658.1 Sim4 and Mal2-associated protein 2 [Schizosaccharomyces pombe]